MFEKARWHFTLKRRVLFATILSLLTYTLCYSAIFSPWLFGMVVGGGAFFGPGLLSTRRQHMCAVLAPLLFFLFPPTQLFAAAFYTGLIAHAGLNILFNFEMFSLFSKQRELGGEEGLQPGAEQLAKEKTILQLLGKLEQKFNFTFHIKTVLDSDAAHKMPILGAAQEYSANQLVITRAIIMGDYTKREYKAILAHEFEHGNNRDSFSEACCRVLFWAISVYAVATFSFAFAFVLVAATYFVSAKLKQTKELQADLFSAEHTHPEALMSAFKKLEKQLEVLRADVRTHSPVTYYRKCFWKKLVTVTGVHSHPSVETRTAYLKEYAAEKQALKNRA